MATNQILTPDMITVAAIPVLTGKLGFAKTVNRDYDDRFGIPGAKIGNHIDIKRPNKVTGGDGASITVEAYVDTFTPLALTHQWNAGLSFSGTEMSLSIEDFMHNVAMPPLVNIANRIDNDGLKLINNIYNVAYVPGSTSGGGQAITAITGGPSGTTIDTVLSAGTLLDVNLADRDGNRCVTASPLLEQRAVSNGLNLFNPQAKISNQYETAMLQSGVLGFDWYLDQNMPSHTNGTFGGTPVVATTTTSGSSLDTSGWTSTTTSLNVGDVFTVAGVYTVNAQTKSITGQLQQFVVTEQTVDDGSGNTTIKISPAIVTTGSFQNVSKAPTANDAIVVVGASATTYQQSLAAHRNAFVLGIADLPRYDKGVVGFASVASDKIDNVSIRMIRGYMILDDQEVTRFDVLGGWTTLYEQTACRIALG